MLPGMEIRAWSLSRGALLGLALAGCVDDGGAGSDTDPGRMTGVYLPSSTTAAPATTSEVTDSTDSTGATGTTADETSSAEATAAVESTGSADPSSSGTTEDSASVLGFESDIWPIFGPNCACHQESAGDLKLSKSQGHANLVEQSSKQVKGMLLVAPGLVDESYLWHKLANTHQSVGGSGKFMPSGGMLDPGELDIVQLWIDQGAAP